jgi:tetratricopeptide (TPR) repeat protein
VTDAWDEKEENVPETTTTAIAATSATTTATTTTATAIHTRITTPTAAMSIEELDSKIKVIALEGLAEKKVVGPEVPDAIKDVQEKSFDERFAELNRVPLFMRQLDETDGAEGENVELEALKSLAYEGEPWEVATSFKENGNESFGKMEYKDALEYYTKAILVKCGKQEIDEACFVNRAACNLQLENYGKVLADCARALRINPENMKALYRSTKACLAVDRLDEAQDLIDRGLKLDPTNKAMLQQLAMLEKRLKHVLEVTKKREDREARAALEKKTLEEAIQMRKLDLRYSPRPPDLGDAKISLSNPIDATSLLAFPIIFLYPLTFESDFVQQCAERETFGDEIDMILSNSPPWDTKGQYKPALVDLFIETKTGSVLKLGRKVTLGNVLATGKVEIWDSVIQIYIVPKTESAAWVEDFKANAHKRRRPTA